MSPRRALLTSTIMAVAPTLLFLIYSEKFSDVSSDAFYVSIEVDDPKYDENNVIDFLKNIGGTEIEVLTDEN